MNKSEASRISYAKGVVISGFCCMERCGAAVLPGHICNASYAVKAGMRGCHIGEALVIHCMEMGKELGFKILQFNAVVRTNGSALHLYEKLGFIRLGVIPGGFLMKDGSCEDIIPHYHVL